MPGCFSADDSLLQMVGWVFLQLATQMKMVIVQVLSHSDEEEFNFLSGPAERSCEESHADPLKSSPELGCGVSAPAAHV